MPPMIEKDIINSHKKPNAEFSIAKKSNCFPETLKATGINGINSIPTSDNGLGINDTAIVKPAACKMVIFSNFNFSSLLLNLNVPNTIRKNPKRNKAVYIISAFDIFLILYNLLLTTILLAL